MASRLIILRLIPWRWIGPWLALIGLLTVAVRGNAQDLDEIELLPPLGALPAPAEISPTAPAELPPAGTVEELVEPVPMTTDDGRWWTRPASWFAGPIWDFGSELGINGSDGNSQSFSLLVAFNGKRDTAGSTLEWDLKHGKTETGGIETQNFAILNSRWDWKLSPLWLVYNKNMFEYDEFKAFDIRLVLSGGLGYHVIKNDLTTWTGRLGAGTSREIGGPDNTWVPEANVGSDLEHKLSARQKLKFASDYYPSFDDFTDYRMVSNAHWEILLDEETNLNLKLGIVDRYDSTPNGVKPNDITYFATLLWKL